MGLNRRKEIHIGKLDSLDYIIEVEVKFLNAKTGDVVKRGGFQIGVRDLHPERKMVQIIGFPQAETSEEFLKRVVEEADFVNSLCKHAKWLAKKQLKVTIRRS